MENCKIGNLYICKFETDIFSGFSFPILEWNEKDNLWTLAKLNPYSKTKFNLNSKTTVEQFVPCMFVGNTNVRSIGAFLLEDYITGIEFRYIHES